MKRELAALETESPVSDNFGRKTRSGCSNGDSHRLVYKRVKRSLSSVAAVVSEGVNVEKAAAVVVEVAVSNGGGAVEVVKEEGKIESLSEKEKNLGEGEKENGDISVAEVEKMVVENVDGVSIMEVDEKGENRSEKAEEMVAEVVGSVEGDVSVKTVENGDISVAEVGGSVEDDVSVKSVENGGVEVVASDNVANGSLVSDEIANKEKVIEETRSKSPFKVGNGKGKKFGIERYQRRFTRSALKSNNVTEEMLKEDKVKEVNGSKEIGIEEKVKEMVSDGNAEVSKEEIVVQNHVSETTDGLVKDCLVEESVKRVTRSLISKPKEDGTDSCVTETSDSVVPDKENEELGASAENGMCDMDKDVEETETFLETPRKKLEIKMSKQIGVARIPTTVRDLFETGLLEGCPVYYDGVKGPGLRGRIRAIGICCPCNLCRGSKIIAPSLFEIHACNSYKRAVQYICLENGRSLIQILKACKTTRMKTLEETVKNAIGPLPKMVVVVCLNCKEPYSTMDAECADPVCSSCIMSNLSPVGPVYSSRKLCRSSSFVSHQQAASASGILEGYSLGKSVAKATRQKKSAAKSAAAKVRSSSRAGRMPETSTSQKTMKNSEEVYLVPKASSSPLTGKPVAAKTPKKLMKKLSKAALSPKPSKLTRVGKSAPVDGRLKSVKRLRKETLTPKASKTPSVHGSSEKRATGKITRKDIRLHKLVFEDDVLPDGTELGYYAKGKKLLDGYKKGPGIFCNCCETVVSASQFEAHAGCAARRKPYCYIYTSNGVSLHELSVNLIKGRKHSAKFNDDLCSICADGGNLLLCDGCPRAFHTECASLSSVPRGKWYCKYCENMFEREKFVAHNANAFAAGRVSGVDPMEQITKRSIRIVNNVGSEVSSCILCRGFDFCKSGFGPRTIILCDQCEKEYHVGCLKDHNMADLAELPEGKWFCSVDCGRIDSALQNLLVRGEEKLPESLVNIIKRKNLQNGSECATDVDVSWRLLSGKIASSETRPLLSQAVAIFHESFAPIVDVVSGHDLIPAMVYGRNVGGQEYGGMYCAVLTIDSVVVSAGIFRVFGPEVAELPLVATSSGNHGKGYFQALFACIERLLAFLNIKSFVLPAAEEAESIWTDRFGFKKMTPDQLRELKSNFWSMVRFQGTSMLHKSVPECRVIQNPADQD